MRLNNCQYKMMLTYILASALSLLGASGCLQDSNLFGGVPDLLQPLNGQVLTETSPYFDWSDVAGATRFHLRVNSVQTGLAVIDKDDLMSSEYYAVEILTPGDYQWQVQAGDDKNWGSWSVRWTFTIQQGIPVQQ